MTGSTEIYRGRLLQDAFRAVAHDLSGMRVALHLAIGAKDSAVRREYARSVASREQDLVNLADYPTPRDWQQTILRRTNNLLYGIHLHIQLPLWQYVIEEYLSVDTGDVVVTAVRTSERYL